MKVYVERAPRRAFACALDWPGWCRSGKTEDDALEALAAYRDRYAVVADRARVRFPARPRLEVVERLKGGATTDFGAIEKAASADGAALSAAAASKLVSLLEASWAVFDDVAAGAPRSLRKGPRGGGRDTPGIVAHVDDAEVAYARKLGIKGATDRDERRALVADALRSARAGKPLVEKGWLPRYAVRRIAWHVLDHAWEIEDKSG